MDTEERIEASIEGAYITERIGKGTTFVKWYAKKIDYQNPWYNDTVVYRKVRGENTDLLEILELNLLFSCRYTFYAETIRKLSDVVGYPKPGGHLTFLVPEVDPEPDFFYPTTSV